MENAEPHAMGSKTSAAEAEAPSHNNRVREATYWSEFVKRLTEWSDLVKRLSEATWRSDLVKLLSPLSELYYLDHVHSRTVKMPYIHGPSSTYHHLPAPWTDLSCGLESMPKYLAIRIVALAPSWYRKIYTLAIRVFPDVVSQKFRQKTTIEIWFILHLFIKKKHKLCIYCFFLLKIFQNL